MSGDIQVDEIRVTNTTDSTSYDSGALTVAGGVGVGGKLSVAGLTKFHSGQDVTSPATPA